jgi:16S rRNA (guanine1516-N2)-methyltransferase
MQMQLKMAIAAETSQCLKKAKILAKKLNFPIVNINVKDYDFLIVATEQRLELRETVAKRTKPLYVDFLHGTAAHRRKYGGGRGQLIARAVGIKSGVKLQVLDATAGLGRDAFVLACLGCKLLLLERSSVIAALLEDGLERAKSDPAFANIDMHLMVCDAISYMTNINYANKPDVVYLDPMYPVSRKSALAKKEMHILRQIVGPNSDVDKLLQASLKTALKRVVVKRPRLAPQITGPKPNLVLTGKSSRFDVYLTHLFS